ncbi:hypothetical protein GCM10011608_01800 [Micromonospora sonchi]|uniref:Uncharacterized protein n=2 Tax=Micromonospora sonchi TaxID=1763543 RepID=A0A917TFK8_9ACTN|nr:hypothetical protein GCM10011608_01800 [Micromonospora sonchi]
MMPNDLCKRPSQVATTNQAYRVRSGPQITESACIATASGDDRRREPPNRPTSTRRYRPIHEAAPSAHTAPDVPHFTSITPGAKITAECLLKIGAAHDLPSIIEQKCGAIV